jgi:hypothetical protein
MAFAAIGLAVGATAATAAATGAVVAGTAASIGLGAYGAIKGSKQQSNAQKRLDEQARNSPIYKPDKSIDTYYQEAMNRYKENPFQSQQYQVGAQNIQRASAQGISALQDRRSAIGGIGRLQANQMGAMQNLGAQAEASKQQRLGQLGQATQLKSGDYQRQFDINKMTPYNRQLQLEQMKAQAAGERYNAGMQMVGQGINNLGTYAAAGGLEGFKGFGKKTNYNNKGLYQGSINDILPTSTMS